MRHFMAQFGPALQWPWTKLTDVPGADRRAARHDRRAVRRAGGGPQRARARAAARRLPRLGAAGAARARHRRRAPCSPATSARSRRPRARRVLADGDDLSQPLALHTARGRARLGRLQRPRAREPLPAGLRRRLRRALRVPRHRRRVPRGAAATSRSRATSRTCARRCSTTASRSRRRCSTATRAGCTSSTRSGARATARCSRRPSSCSCTSTRSRAARRPPAPRCSRASQRIARGARRAAASRARGPRRSASRAAAERAQADGGVDAREPLGGRGGLAARALDVAVGARRHDHHVDVPGPAGARRAHPAARAHVLGALAVGAAAGDLDRDDVRAQVAGRPQE